YFFDGEGYGPQIEGQATTRVLPAAYPLFLNPQENGLAPDPEDEEGVDTPALAESGIANFGRRYAAISFGLGELFGTSLGFNGALILNLTDLSGIASPSVSLEFLDIFSLSLSARFSFGPKGGEYMNPAGLISGDTSSPGTLGLKIGRAHV